MIAKLIAVLFFLHHSLFFLDLMIAEDSERDYSTKQRILAEMTQFFLRFTRVTSALWDKKGFVVPPKKAQEIYPVIAAKLTNSKKENQKNKSPCNL